MENGLQRKCLELQTLLDALPRVLVAYSGGVDSSFLLWFATHRSRTQPLGILADSESLKRAELEDARTFATRHQLPLRIVRTEELRNPDYAANPLNRCYYCKHTLFEEMDQLARQENVDALCYGENADDGGFNRPGRQAAQKFQIRAPLQEAGLTKQDIRCLADDFGLEIADKPAQPCLASRIQHGVPVTSERLKTVEQAEAILSDLGFRITRVRHQGDRALVQVAPEETPRLLDPKVATRVRSQIRACGFQEVELDQNGYRGAGLL